MALLATSVVLGLSLVTIAVRNQDYPGHRQLLRGRQGHQPLLERENLAVRLQVHAKVKVDDLTGEVEVRLTGNSRPDQLTLNLISPAQPEKDRRVELLRSSSDRERYVGQLTDAVREPSLRRTARPGRQRPVASFRGRGGIADRGHGAG